MEVNLAVRFGAAVNYGICTAIKREGVTVSQNTHRIRGIFIMISVVVQNAYYEWK